MAYILLIDAFEYKLENIILYYLVINKENKFYSKNKLDI